ncbi:hypothetical protein [Mesoterricola silvestris]|uniref:Uncharacterized protein n=1 Tax=Mesoterricola silvestris TaxID=2927979 RepID=A0AA48KAD7_9BACT|nr:hypothetical protein [Mesoterricola silvestris]BDU74000.1 hypothetical protein METEAL_31740 [Mesoterricola silvestris]
MFRHRGMNVRKGIGIAVLGVAAVAVLGWVVMALWNGIMPMTFGLKAIGFWQGLGLLVLSRILFGGFHRSHGGAWHRRHHLMRRWEAMTPEEREAFRQGMHRHGCGWGGRQPEGKSE